MTKNMNKKMLAYSAVASAFLAGATEAQAQVDYTDVDPDTTLSSAAMATAPVEFAIDFNGDGTAEFSARQINNAPTQTYAQFAVATGAPNIEMMGTQGSFYIYPTVLAAGDTITPNMTFESDNIAALRSSYGGNFYGNFDGLSGFVGCRFDVGGNMHYGWVEAEASTDATELTIKGFAYDMTPDTGIEAGDIGPGVNVVQLESVGAVLGQVQPNPATSIAQLPISLEKAADVEIGVFSVIGETMERRNQALASGEHFLEFSFENYPAGQYFVRLRVGNQLITRKVTVQ